MLSGRKRISKRPTTTEEWRKPLHVKTVPRINWRAARDLFSNEELIIFDKYSKYVREPAQCCQTRLTELHHEDAELLHEDITLLVQANYIRPLGEGETVIGHVRVFSVLEKSNSRRRVVCCPDEYNALLSDVGNIDLPHIDSTLDGDDFHALTADFSSFYIQFGLTNEEGRQFCFTHGEQVFALCTIATGQRQCPMLAQLVSTKIVRTAISNMMAGDIVAGTVYIDNIRLRGPREMVETVWLEVLHICSELNLHIEVESPWGNEYDFLGLSYDGPVARLMEKHVDKLRGCLHHIAECFQPEFTARQFLQLFGLLIHASRMLNIPCFTYFHVFKFLRRRGTLDIDSPIFLWRCLEAQLKHWLEATIRNQWRDLRQTCKERLPVVAVTDASETGWGVVVFYESQVHVSSGTFVFVEPIAVLEGRALLRALDLLARLGALRHRITFFVDNTNLAFAIKKKRSAMYALNVVVGQIIALSPTSQVRWLPSATNIADALSRLGTTAAASFGSDDIDANAVLDALDQVSISIC